LRNPLLFSPKANVNLLKVGMGDNVLGLTATTATCEFTNLQSERHLSLASNCIWSRLLEAAVLMRLSDKPC